MPPRPVTLAIVVFWLASTGWLFVRDLWPVLRPGQRPPFTIDLTREAEGRKSGTHWVMYRNGERVGIANATTQYDRRDGNYTLVTQINFEKFKHAVTLPLLGQRVEFDFRRLKSTYHVTAEGELIGMKADLDMAFRIDNLEEALLTVQVVGEVADGFLTPHWSIQTPQGLEPDFLLDQLARGWDSEPIDVRGHGNMLNPMHPWNRLLNVREGQTWHMTLFDPLQTSLGGFLGKGGVRRLEAGVLEGTQELYWDGKNVPCLVIKYKGDKLEAQTWVRQSDGLVLRQEAERPGERLALERETR
ncbi:MAG TPA: hypothetical protein VNK04_06515 [Gemmataceae bacterium]|jgi:hypothetical protein|nr:hypothetical protein [Gemmataceae bacterium]